MEEHMPRLRRLSGVVVLLVLWGSSWAFAQEQGGSIQGIVRDSSGGVLPGVTIEARSPSVVGVSSTLTDSRGEYRFPALPSGTYEITATLQGFATKKLSDTLLQLGQILRVDVTMQVAALSESVVVTGESPVIDVKQNAAAASITREIIDLLPKGRARDFTNMATLAPGANDESKSGGIQIDGSSGSENRYIVDGVDTTALRNGVSNKTVYSDFIQEVQVKSSGYAAEFGGSTGGVISAITKSGSNTYHGSLGTYFKSNDLLGASRSFWRINTFDDRTAEFVTNRDDQQSIWSPIGDLGGPLLHDKLWFYVGSTYDHTGNERTATFRSSPTPFATRTFNWWSSSNYLNWNVSSQLNNNMRLKVAGGNERSRNRGTAPTLLPNGSKFTDGTPTDGWTSGAWDADPEKFKDRWERTGTNDLNDLYSALLQWTVAPKYFVEVAGGYLWYDTSNPPDFAGNQLIHSFGASNICAGAAGSSTCPFPEIPASLQFPNGYSDNKSTNRIIKDRYSRTYLNANNVWFKSLKGEHILKAGVRFERLANDVNRGNQQPTISFNWNQTRATLDGRSVRGKYGYYSITRSYTAGTVASNNWSFWIQDGWTINSKLTINAGVRTENEHVPSYRAEDPGIEFGFRDKIAPRLGFAYDIRGDSKWKAYGSYGKYFDITKLEMPRGSFGAEHSIQYYYTLESFDWPSFSCAEGPTGCSGTYIEQRDLRHPANAVDDRLTAYFGKPQNTLDPNLKPVEAGELSFGLDHELTGRSSLGVRYTHKWLVRTIEDTGIVVPGVGEVFFMANPGFGVGGQVLPAPSPPNPHAIRDYDGVEVRYQKRLSNRWSLSSSYLWSRLFGNYSGLASSDENGRTSPNVNRYFDALYLSYDTTGTKEPVLGLLQTDRPNQLKTQVSYQFPWGTSVGLDNFIGNGTPLQSQLNWRGFNGVYFKGRDDLGRTPTLSYFDLFLQHELKLFGGRRMNVNMNVFNLFDQRTVTNFNVSPFRDQFNGSPLVPTTPTTASDAFFFNGFDPYALAAAMRAAGATQRDNPLYTLPAATTDYWRRREIRFGLKFTF
jgi:hypothetical protein